MCASLRIITIKSQHKVINRSNAAKVLEKSLKEAGVSFHDNDFKGWTAHHIVAYEATAAGYSRAVLEALDIDINSADYIEYVESEIIRKLQQFDSDVDWSNPTEAINKLTPKKKKQLRNDICETIFEIKKELLNGTLSINNAL